MVEQTCRQPAINPGSNDPFVVRFRNTSETTVEQMAEVLVTLWQDLPGGKNRLIKTWWKAQMLVTDNTAICPVTEAETAAMPQTILYIEAKAWNEYGETKLWDQFPIDVKRRRDKDITLAESEG